MARRFRAPAKINLTLEVLARRADGYHGIRSVMVPLELADELAIDAADRFTFECDDPELGGATNVVVRALSALGSITPRRVTLRKRIPVQAGLGGGSSDAAAVLRAAMAGEFGPLSSIDWLGVARELGSDVPFFLAGTGALVEGAGERVTPAGSLPRWHALVVKPPVAVSTAAAYALLDRRPRPSRPRSTSRSMAMLVALQRANFNDAEALLQNDFHDPIAGTVPEVGIALRALASAGASNAMLSGSGSCVFALMPDRAATETLRDRLDLPAAYERFATAFASASEWLTMNSIDVVVLAGGPLDAVAAQQSGALNKAFVDVGGKPLVARVLEALRASPSVGRIVVVAPPPMRGDASMALADELRPDGVRITESLRNGLAGFGPDDPVLIVASDLPILTPAAVEDFIARTHALGADVVYGCVEKAVHLARFPQVPHTWARLRDGTFCGGGLASLRPRAFPHLERFIERLGAARKHPLRLASLFGWDVLASFAAGRLTIAGAEARASKILGAPVRAAVSPFAETAVNVDRVSDIALARELVTPASSNA